MKLPSRVVQDLRTVLFTVCIAAVMGTCPALAQTQPPGVPVPEDSAIFKAFKQLEKQPAYRMTLSMESSDPRMAQLSAKGMGPSPSEMISNGGARQVTMHLKTPAMDQPGTIDDWEIRAVVQNGRGARLITSPSLPRILRYSEQMLSMQMAMLNAQAAMAMAQAAAEGPVGAIMAANIAAQTAIANVMAARALQKQKDFFSWQCMSQLGGGQKGDKKTNQLTDMRALGDQNVAGVSATAFEFYVRDGDKLQGPVRLLVDEDTGLPLRIEMTDPQGRGSLRMDYSFENITDIEFPPCMASAQ